MEFHRRKKFPESFQNEWEVIPEEGQRVEVQYTTGSTNQNVWFQRGKFVNLFGFELFNIIGWKPAYQEEAEKEYQP